MSAKSILQSSRAARRADKQDTYETRKARAMVVGHEYVYMVCPMCHWNRPYKSARPFGFDPSAPVLETKKGGGYGIGFFRMDDKDIDLKALKAQDPVLFENIKRQALAMSAYVSRL